MEIKLGTRTSRLAMWQTEYIASSLQARWPHVTCEIVPFTTKGDQTQLSGIELPKIGGKGLFTAELEAALREKRIDLAVHSLKDLPVDDAPGLTVGCIPDRADARDALISATPNYHTLDSLPTGSVVGTSSLRRQSQILAARPDLIVRSIRGNVDTRIRKMESGAYDAIVLAAAGVIRLGLDHLITDWFEPDVMQPAPGQGALGVQCRDADEEILALLAGIHNPQVANCVIAERRFLQALGGGCSLPVGAYATVADGVIQLAGRVVLPDGSQTIHVTTSATDPLDAGKQAADDALRQGAMALLPEADSDHNPNQINRGTPLAGKRIIVTRSTEQAGLFAEKLAAKGATPILFPVIRFEPIPSPEFDDLALDQFDWLLFTSVNAVRFFGERFPALLNQLKEKPRSVSVAVSGSATQANLETRGISVDFVPDRFVGEELIAGLGHIKGKSVLLPRAKKGRPEIVNLIRQYGANCTEVPLYDTVTASPTPADYAAIQNRPDVVTFTSPSSVRNFMKLMHASDFNLNEIVIASIGPITSAELRKSKLPIHIEADPYTLDGIVDGLVAFFRHKELMSSKQ